MKAKYWAPRFRNELRSVTQKTFRFRNERARCRFQSNRSSKSTRLRPRGRNTGQRSPTQQVHCQVMGYQLAFPGRLTELKLTNRVSRISTVNQTIVSSLSAWRKFLGNRGCPVSETSGRALQTRVARSQRQSCPVSKTTLLGPKDKIARSPRQIHRGIASDFRNLEFPH